MANLVPFLHKIDEVLNVPMPTRHRDHKAGLKKPYKKNKGSRRMAMKGTYHSKWSYGKLGHSSFYR